MDKRNYAFGKTNFILLAVGMLIVVVGFCLMSGGGSDETVFDASIFDVRRIKVAPVVCLVGFLSMIYAIVHKPKDNGDNNIEETKADDDVEAEWLKR